MNKWLRWARAVVLGIVLGMAYNWAFAAPQLPSPQACEFAGNITMLSLALRQADADERKSLAVLDSIYLPQLADTPNLQQLFADLIQQLHRFTGRAELRDLSPLQMETMFTMGCQLHRGNLGVLMGTSL